LEIVLVTLAYDAYRIAQRKIEGILEVVPQRVPVRPEGGLPAAIPLALAGLIVVSYVGFVALGLLLPSYQPVDQSQASVTDQQNGKRYANPKYGVQLTVPPDWQISTSEAGAFLTAQKQTGFCTVGLLAEGILPGSGAEGYLSALTSQLGMEEIPWHLERNEVGTLSGYPSREAIFVSQQPGFSTTSRYSLVERGLSIFALYTMAITDQEELCASDFEAIRKSLVLP
jgi:hypothetical protein